MYRHKTILYILAGLVCAFALWWTMLFVQKNYFAPKTKQPSTSPLANVIPAEHVIAPANILSAAQRGAEFSITGQGVAGAIITLRSAQGNTVARAKVDGLGAWAVTFKKPIPSDVLKLTIHMATPDGQDILSGLSLFIIAHKIKNPITENAPAPQGQQHYIILTAPGTNSTVLQSPFQTMPSKDGFTLQVIDYDNSGGVIFSGRSQRPGKVRIYANGKLLGESRTGTKGRWSLIFGNILPLGEYTISAQLIPKNESALVKLTLPFSRMRPLFEAEASPKILVQHLKNRMQMGWFVTGGGYQYVVIYAKNALM